MVDNELLQAIAQMMDSKLEPINQRLDKIDQRLDKVEERLDRMEERLDKVEERFDRMEKDVSSIKLTLENEMDRNIQLLAEGYLPMAEKVEVIFDTTEETKLIVDIIEKVVNKHSYDIQKLKKAN